MMRSFQTIGEEVPRPASVAFHAMFSLALQVNGRLDSEDTPRLDGPRHCGQFSADSCVATSETAPTTAKTNLAPKNARTAWTRVFIWRQQVYSSLLIGSGESRQESCDRAGAYAPVVAPVKSDPPQGGSLVAFVLRSSLLQGGRP